MKGYIIANPFGYPVQAVHQAERMQKEFNKIGVQVVTVKNGWLNTVVKDGDLSVKLKGADFVLFLDKDKYLSSALKKSGIRLFNNHDGIRVCDDKGETYLALSGNGLNIPKTYFAPLCFREEGKIDIDGIKSVGKELGYPVIVKESYGSLGLGVYKADDEKSLIEISEKLKMKPHLYQEYLPYRFGTDVRVIVIGGKAVAGMERVNENDFRSNIGHGGKGNKIELSAEFIECAEKVAKILELDYCGVDILYGKNGEPYVCEVNSNAFFDGIESVTGINIAKIYAEYIKTTVENRK